MSRHGLMLGVIVMGMLLVGAQLSKRQLDTAISSTMRQAISAATPVSEKVDQAFAQGWERHGLEPAAAADHLTVARRLSLALTGTVPSLEEIRSMQSLPQADQIPWWLGHLLQDRRYGDYVAERIARSVVGTEDGPFLVFRRRRFVSWLSDCLMENRPYDEIVRDLISEHGNWTGNPAVNFVTVTTGSAEEEQPDPERLAARTSRAFLGVRLDCMQCHDDNLGGDWLQSDFQQLAAFYAEARSFGLGLGIQDSPRDYEFKYLGAEEVETIPPRVPFATDLFVESAQPRRQQLAAWVTHRENEAFARATVNRVWAIMFGRPLVDPVDDIPLQGPYPPGLQVLAEDFAEHHDLQRLILQIAMTRVFQLESRLPAGVTSTDEAHWCVFPLVRLRPEQVAGSIVQSCSLTTIDSSSHILMRLTQFDQMEKFVKRYGDQGEDEFEGGGGTITQRLVLLNGNLVQERTKDDLVTNAATRIAQQVDDDTEAIEAAFLVVLTRQPTPEETSHFQQHMRDHSLSRAQRLEDIFWTLLNSTEFSWNH